MNYLSSDQTNQARSILDSAKSLLIAIRANPNTDAIAAGLALYLSLLKKGRSVTVSCASPMTVQFNRVIGVNKITRTLAGGNDKNLIISFPYQEGSIEKVSYNIEGSQFHLVIEPREGYPKITSDLVRYSSEQGAFDAVLTVGIEKFSDLGDLFQHARGVFERSPVIVIDRAAHASPLGKVALTSPHASSLSELMLHVISQTGLPVDGDIATNVFLGMSWQTEHFTSDATNASTFEAAAFCLRKGGRNVSPVSSPSSSGTPKPFSFPFNHQQVSVPGRGAGTPSSSSQPPQTSQPVSSGQAAGHVSEPPTDWLKPKIYKGSSLI